MKDNISDFPGYYVTVDGKVYSRKNNRHGYLKDYHLLKTKYTKHDGRPYVTLRNPKLGIRRLAKVHRLVALAYIPNPENKPCVCHKDNNSLNNNVDNLYWGTQAENMSQMRFDKRDYRKVSIRAHRRVLRLKSLGWSSSRIGKRFKVNRTCINRILNKYRPY
jgi:hypothetical protein